MAEFNNNNEYNETNRSNDLQEIKYLNDTFDETMTSFTENDSEPDMNEIESKNKMDYILTGLMFISIVLIVLSHISDMLGLLFLGIVMIFVIKDIASPLNKVYKDGGFDNKLVRGIFFIRASVVIAFTISLYLILLSKRYNLKYSYWVCFLSLILLILFSFLQGFWHRYIDRRVKGKKQNDLYFIGSLLMVIALTSVQYLELKPIFITESKQINLEQMKAPNSITIYQHNRWNSGFVLNNQITIDKTDDINMILSDLSGRTLKSLTSIESLNYQRLKAKNTPYYNLFFDFEDNVSNENIFNNNIVFLVVTSNEIAAIEVLQIGKTSFFNKDIRYIYSVTLSEETYHMLSTYFNEL
jgi:hypothetical protein